MAAISVARTLFSGSPDAPSLYGGRHRESGRLVFPLPEDADQNGYDAVQLKTEGKLWSWTVQRFRPKSPPYAGTESDQDFKPFAVGYVELEGEIIVETRIATDNFAALKIGMEMEMTLIPFRTNDAGDEVYTYAFRPKG